MTATRTRKIMTALRIDADQLAEIDRRAESYKMSRTGYMIAAALDELPEQLEQRQKRLEAIESRLDRLERSLGNSG